jgi:uncharacterized membrane protein
VQLEAELLTTPARVAALVLTLPAVALAAATAPWAGWLGRADRQHAYLGGLVLLLIVWSLRAGVTPGLTLQFLLVSALTLMHGWSLAVIGVGVVLGAEALQHGGFDAWPANLLCFGIVPATTTALIHRLLEARLPHNYFVYFFGTAFAGSLVAFLCASLARLALLWFAGTLPGAQVGDEYLLLLPMMALAEAFMNGLIIAIAVVYSPGWVASFDDRRYLGH